MLTLLPLTGLQAALKRRNSKTIDFSRRGSISVYSTYSLPRDSKSSMRKFSSYEELAPIFQLMQNDEDVSKPRSIMGRRASVAVTTSSRSQADGACAALDAQLARIRGQLVSIIYTLEYSLLLSSCQTCIYIQLKIYYQ